VETSQKLVRGDKVGEETQDVRGHIRRSCIVIINCDTSFFECFWSGKTF